MEVGYGGGEPVIMSVRWVGSIDQLVVWLDSL